MKNQSVESLNKQNNRLAASIQQLTKYLITRFIFPLKLLFPTDASHLFNVFHKEFLNKNHRSCKFVVVFFVFHIGKSLPYRNVETDKSIWAIMVGKWMPSITLTGLVFLLCTALNLLISISNGFWISENVYIIFGIFTKKKKKKKKRNLHVGVLWSKLYIRR